VLATLHTNDAPTAIPRLIDIGIEPYLVTSTLLAALAQRLLRRTCQACKGTGLGNATGFYAGKCEKCYGAKYYGRIAVYEIMKMNDDLRKLTVTGADGVSIGELARQTGMRTLVDDARDKIALGLTTEDEIRRVLY